jgi:hypothetical protein
MTEEQQEQVTEILEGLSQCMDESCQVQDTHYIYDDKIEPKGSFIALVQHARKLLESLKATA